MFIVGDMTWLGITVVLAASLIAGSEAIARSLQVSPLVGEQHEIIVSYQTSRKGSDGSSSTSNGQDVIRERVIAANDLGLELEFDLTPDATAEDRARAWQFPARVLQSSIGTLRLLNGRQLESRAAAWLAAAGLAREMCGRWIFTWNAFRIECDPESVIADIEAFNLLALDLREGARYRHPETLRSGTLIRTMDGTDGATLSVSLEVDADAIRWSRAETDVAVGEMMRQPVTFENALHERSKEMVTGSVEITIDIDAAGRPTRRKVVTMLKTVGLDGVIETGSRTETVERRVVLDPASR